MASAWSDLVSDFMALTEGHLTPPIFRKWSGIALVAGALERRVWAKTGPRQTFPNLFTLLVAPPGVGKYVIEEVHQLWSEALEPGTKVAAFRVAPDSMTKASLVDNLVKANNRSLLPSAPGLLYHSLLIAAEEFGVLMPAYDMEYIGTLNSIWNNKSSHRESRRTGTVKELEIANPQLNILGGAQPGWLGSVFPEEAWSTGLASRLIMVYSSEGPLRDPFDDPGYEEGLRHRLLARLGEASQLYGQMQWEPAAAERLRSWHMASGPPTPGHSKLAYYVKRRTQHVIKLMIVSAISRAGELVIRDVDSARGIEWLLEAESTMPDIFRAMVGRSDAQVLEELHYFVTGLWAKSQRQPVPTRALAGFLLQRVPHDKVSGLMEMADRANIVVRVAGSQDKWIPKPKSEHGME